MIALDKMRYIALIKLVEMGYILTNFGLITAKKLKSYKIKILTINLYIFYNKKRCKMFILGFITCLVFMGLAYFGMSKVVEYHYKNNLFKR